MNFKGHLIGGFFASCTLCFVAATISDLNAVYALQITLVTMFFSLFPDLDISSIPQRWFYRIIIIILILCFVNKKFKLATLLAIAVLTPLISKHRGWTHSILAPLTAPIVIAASYYHIFIQNISLKYTLILKICDLLTTHLWLAIACSVGWSTHLCLDFLIPKKLTTKKFRGRRKKKH